MIITEDFVEGQFDDVEGIGYFPDRWLVDKDL